MGSVAALIKTIRPRQWVKNVFVAAPLVFARHLQDGGYLVRSAVAVAAFCALSGAVYAFNDVRDLASDRVHPTKRNRPIAAGQLSTRAAMIWSAILATSALVACGALGWLCLAYAAGYFAQNIAYSVKLKHVAFLDVGLIASGFLLRVLAGAAAIDVPASPWVFVCTALIAVFFGLGKRAHELAWAERTGQASSTRAALAGYSLPVVRVTMLVIGAVTLAAYIAYTIDGRTQQQFHTDQLIYSSPFVAIGIVRFLFLALWRPKDDSPTEAMLKDPWFLLNLAAATATVLFVIYHRPG